MWLRCDEFAIFFSRFEISFNRRVSYLFSGRIWLWMFDLFKWIHIKWKINMILMEDVGVEHLWNRRLSTLSFRRTCRITLKCDILREVEYCFYNFHSHWNGSPPLADETRTRIVAEISLLERNILSHRKLYSSKALIPLLHSSPSSPSPPLSSVIVMTFFNVPSSVTISLHCHHEIIHGWAGRATYVNASNRFTEA